MVGEYVRLVLASRQLHRFYTHQFSPFMTRTGLTMREIHVLLFLSNNPGYDTARDICQLRSLSKSQVSQAVESLSSVGFLLRTPDQADRRIVHLAISPEGLPLARECQAIQEACFRQLLGRLTPEQATQFQDLLKQILDHSEQLAREVPQ